MNINSEYTYIKFKVDNEILEALKKILTYKKIAQQDFLENMINEYVVKNIKILLTNNGKEE